MHINIGYPIDKSLLINLLGFIYVKSSKICVGVKLCGNDATPSPQELWLKRHRLVNKTTKKSLWSLFGLQWRVISETQRSTVRVKQLTAWLLMTTWRLPVMTARTPATNDFAVVSVTVCHCFHRRVYTRSSIRLKWVKSSMTVNHWLTWFLRGA